MMLELLLETNYLFLAVASLATVLVVVISWRILFNKQTGKELEDNQKDDDNQMTENRSEEDLADVDNLLIDSADLEILDSKEIEKLQEGADDSPSKESNEANMKRVRAKELEEEMTKEMTEDQLDEEKRVREQQLAAIFKLMQDNQERFGVDSVEDVKSQYKLYA